MNSEGDPLALLGTIWRGKWIIAFFATLAVLWGGYQAYFVLEPKYASQTTIALLARNERVVDIESVVSGVSTDTSALNTEIEVLRSGALLRRLVEELDLIEDPEFNTALRPEPPLSLTTLRVQGSQWLAARISGDTSAREPDPETVRAARMTATINQVRSAITVINQRSTYVFVIGARTDSPAKSALIADTLAELYIEDQIAQKFEGTENAVAWLSERVVELEGELEMMENRVRATRANMTVTTREQHEALTQQANDLRERLSDTQLDIERQRRRVEDLAALLQDGDFGAIAAAVDDQVLSRLYDEMQNGERDARNRYLDRLQRLTNEAEADLASLEQQRDVLQSSFDRLEAENVRQGERLIELEQLERETSTTRTLYETLLTRLRETSVQRGLQKADARVLTNASVGRYVEPRKSRILLFSALLGAIVGAVVVLWRESGQNGFRTPDELADSSGLPVLGQVPKMPIRSPNQLVSYLTGNPTSAAVEAIRNLRTSIMMSMRAAGSHVLLSTSSVPGEGKTTQAVSLAHNYATLGKKVLLVECDLRRRTLDNYFSVPAAKEGLSALAMGEARLEDCIVRSSISGLDVLLSQEMEINAADFFLSAEFEALIAKLRETYEIIILDAPPVLAVTDSRILGRLSDMILFSVAWDRTDRDQLAAALAEFDAFDRSMIGLVLSRIDARGMRRYGYGERYGAYAAYGRKYYNT